MTVAKSGTYYHQRKALHDVTRDMAAVAMGFLPADLIIKNGKLINVNTSQIQPGIDIAIKHGFIALVGNADHVLADENTKIVDANGRYLAPGFIDSHMHIESTMVDIRSFAAGILPHGTTTICPDNHEITNVFGLKAVELFHKAAEGLPLKVFLAMPVCVPSIPGFEDAGATITAEEVAKAYEEGWAQLQGEQMNFPGVIYGDPNTHAITAASLKAGIILTGHYASLELNKGLNAFIASGMNACHESTTAEATLKRAQLGMYPQQRYGTAWLDMPNTIKAITENPGIDTRFFSMVTDDVTPATVAYEGHLVRVVREAIRQGVNPITAIQMVTINTAQLLEKARYIGTISPGRAADILILSDLVNVTIDEVYADGVLVSKDGKMVVELPRYDYPEWALKSVHLKKLTEKDFAIPASGKETVRVMRVYPGMVHTTEEFTEMTPVNGGLQSDPSKDIAKIAIFYRHQEKEGLTGTKGLGFMTGATLKPNTAFASTVSHDCHNLMVLGTDDKAMAVAGNALIEAGGGFAVVVDGQIEAIMPLPLAGLMSLEPVAVAAKQVRAVEDAIKKAGCPADSVEMTLSLLGLIVLEELHLSNKGLVELKPGQPPKFVDLVVNK
ncbi:adenine deaminase [Leptolinea tardivitalis]|uniref:Adenine deaminase n=1 Tax=Leptolinea tardivitalis TaxID=229920 RepID=A0A0P6X4F1_9CHLR|nr:adenine deaminase C-terminal domain-containing protein [Leptolinea tardivitalis]KPL74765.1 adenine deaminase [Leptolinea tardivitalis]GAP22861.1 adenine deaminase [Leptolinea tardivitalis]